jgi:hypothetical protein
VEQQALLSAVASAVITRSVEGSPAEGDAFVELVELVRRRVGRTLDTGPAEDRLAALRNALQTEALRDGEFVTQLASLWTAVGRRPAERDAGVRNVVTGKVTGPVVQARDVHGGITFGSTDS